MSDMNSLPFPRGSTYFAPNQSPTAAGGAHLEGKEYLHEASTGGAYVRLRVVRNSAAFPLAPKRLVSFKSGNMGQVDGYAEVTSEQCAPVDDAYKTSIPVGDLFYVVVEGPCLIKTPLAGDATNNIAIGDFIHNTTAATSGAATAGRAMPAVLTGATAVLATAIRNIVGRALSARTTANTDADLLVNVGRW